MTRGKRQEGSPNSGEPPNNERNQERGERGDGRGGRSGGGGGGNNRGGNRSGGEGRGGDREENPFIEKLVAVNRVAKVVKGGKRFGFAALIVIGDQKGRVGFASAKAREVPDAVRKATDAARRRMIRIPLREGRTIHHDVHGHFGAGKVVLRAAPPGTGIIAGGPMRSVFEALGVQDVISKSVGTSNPHNMIRATLEALKNTASPRQVAARRGKKVGDIIGKNKEYANTSSKKDGDEKEAKE
jgi:small subunit ribosomal protein S5